MEAIALAALELVHGGGESSTQIGVGPFQYRSTQTDYSKCVDTAKDIARRQHPSTATWPWSTDTNAGSRARSEADNIRTMCGPPAQS